jgi:hypothetical protein
MLQPKRLPYWGEIEEMGKTCKRQEKPHSKCEANNKIKKLPGDTTSMALS